MAVRQGSNVSSSGEKFKLWSDYAAAQTDMDPRYTLMQNYKEYWIASNLGLKYVTDLL